MILGRPGGEGVSKAMRADLDAGAFATPREKAVEEGFFEGAPRLARPQNGEAQWSAEPQKSVRRRHTK